MTNIHPLLAEKLLPEYFYQFHIKKNLLEKYLPIFLKNRGGQQYQRLDDLIRASNFWGALGEIFIQEHFPHLAQLKIDADEYPVNTDLNADAFLANGVNAQIKTKLGPIKARDFLDFRVASDREQLLFHLNQNKTVKWQIFIRFNIERDVLQNQMLNCILEKKDFTLNLFVWALKTEDFAELIELEWQKHHFTSVQGIFETQFFEDKKPYIRFSLSKCDDLKIFNLQHLQILYMENAMNTAKYCQLAFRKDKQQFQIQFYKDRPLKQANYLGQCTVNPDHNLLTYINSHCTPSDQTSNVLLFRDVTTLDFEQRGSFKLIKSIKIGDKVFELRNKNKPETKIEQSMLKTPIISESIDQLRNSVLTTQESLQTDNLIEQELIKRLKSMTVEELAQVPTNILLKAVNS